MLTCQVSSRRKASVSMPTAVSSSFPADQIQRQLDPGQSASKGLLQMAHDFLAIMPALQILQLNVEGLSASKHNIISSLTERHNTDVFAKRNTCWQQQGKRLHTTCEAAQSSYICPKQHFRWSPCLIIHMLRHYSYRFIPSGECLQATFSALCIANSLPSLPHSAVLVDDFSSHHPDWVYDTGLPNANDIQLADWTFSKWLTSSFDKIGQHQSAVTGLDVSVLQGSALGPLLLTAVL